MAKSDERLWNKEFATLLAIDSMMQLGMYLTRPVISSYAITFGASLALAGFLAGLNATAAMAMRPATGVVSDLLSKKALLVISCALFVASGIGCAFASSIPALTLFCTIQGVAFAFRSTIMTSMVAFVVPKTKLAMGIGWMSLPYTAGACIGPALGSLMGRQFGYSAAFLTAAFFYAAGLLLAASLKLPKPTSTHPKAEDCTTRKMPGISSILYLPAIPLTLTAGLLMVAHGTMNSLVILLSDMNLLEGATLYFSIYAITSLIAKPVAGRIADRHGVAKLAMPCMALAVSAMALLAINRSAFAVALAAFAMGAGHASAYSALQAESVRKTPNEKMGRAANTFFIGPDLGMGLGPILSGFILGACGVQTMFLFAASCTLLALGAFALWRKHLSGK